MKNLFKMTKEENIFLAKRMLVDAVYSASNIEGIAVTWANTVQILENAKVSDVKPQDISKIYCLRDGWEFIIDNIDKPLDLGYIKELHSIIARFDVPWQYLGEIRESQIYVTGGYYPPELSTEKLHNELMELLTIPDDTKRAVDIGLWIMKNQIFYDGNKRVGNFITNKVLIEKGRGIFLVPPEEDSKYKITLVDFYKTGDKKEIYNFIKKKTLTAPKSYLISKSINPKEKSADDDLEL